MADSDTPIGDEVLAEHGVEEIYESQDSPEPPPPFDPETAPAWPDMRDPYFESNEDAERWSGTSDYADGPQEKNLEDPPVPEEGDDDGTTV